MLAAVPAALLPGDRQEGGAALEALPRHPAHAWIWQVGCLESSRLRYLPLHRCYSRDALCVFAPSAAARSPPRFSSTCATKAPTAPSWSRLLVTPATPSPVRRETSAAASPSGEPLIYVHALRHRSLSNLHFHSSAPLFCVFCTQAH